MMGVDRECSYIKIRVSVHETCRLEISTHKITCCSICYFKKVLFLFVAFKLFSIEMQTLLIKSLCFVYMLVNYSVRHVIHYIHAH